MDKEQIDWDMHELASKINAHVIAATSWVNDSWRKELTTYNIPNLVFNRLWLETAFFGVHILQKRFINKVEEKKRELLVGYIREAVISTYPTILGESSEANKEMTDYIVAEFDSTISMYNNYSGVDSKDLFQILIRDVFNTVEDCKIKFVNNTLTTRFKLKLSFVLMALGGAMSGGSALKKYENNVYLPVENLSVFAGSAANEFIEIKESDVFSGM